MIGKLHIVALNIPFPPDYGGVIDIFFKIKSLRKLGIEIILHSFKYDRPESTDLEKYCQKIYYYERKRRIADFFSGIPFIVKTRSHKQLVGNILKDPAPVLFDGLHTCYHLGNKKLEPLPKIVRTHNIEHEYYHALSESTRSLARKFYYLSESEKLRRFEAILQSADSLACISPDDTKYFNSCFGNANLIPAFHPYEEVSSKPGMGSYVLFHGNLSVEENQKALDFILNDVMAGLNVNLIVAGKDPDHGLRVEMKMGKNWQLIENPGLFEMDDLISNAHICLIPSFQSTGLKLKLLASLYSGRFVVANNEMVKNTGLENLCRVGNSAHEIQQIIVNLMKSDFTVEEIRKRRAVLDEDFSNISSAKKLLELIQSNQKKHG